MRFLEVIDMHERNFRVMLKAQQAQDNVICVGLDPVLESIPERFKGTDDASTVFHFNEWIVNQTRGLVCGYKLCDKFYGGKLYPALERTVRYILYTAPQAFVMLDAKCGDPYHTNVQSARAAFDELGVDAVTVFPNPGMEALEPFLSRGDKGVFVVCYMTTDGGDKYDELPLIAGTGRRSTKLYLHVARMAAKWNKRYTNCGVVVSGRDAQILRTVRGAVGDLPMLVPGIGAQGGDPLMAYVAARDRRGGGVIITASRSIMSSTSPREAVLAINKIINDHRRSVCQ